MIFKEAPPDFEPKFEVAACYCINEGEILFLKRHNDKGYGGLWNLPAGKLEPGETPVEAVLREVKEETGFKLSPLQLTSVSTYLCRYPEYDYLFHTFKAEVENRNVVIKEDEATESGWFSPEKALEIDLVPDEDFCIKDAFGIA